MVILASAMKWYYSGSASKSGPGGPQGGLISSVQIAEQTLEGGITIDNTIFNDITTQQASTGRKDYACIYLKNTSAQTATSIKIWQSAITPGADSIRIGYSGVAANSHDPLLTESNTPKYRVPVGTSESRLDHDRSRAGFFVTNPRAIIYDQPITLVELYLKRTGTPTGTLNVRQRSILSETIRVNFGSIDVSTINNSVPTLYQFAAPGNTYKTPLISIIAAEYTGGSASNYISVMRQPGSPIPYMHLVNYDGQQWRNVSDFDLSGNLYTAGTAGDTIAPVGVRFENPLNRDTAITLPNLTTNSFVPIWLERTVPANSPNYMDNTSEIAIEFLSPDT